MKERILMSQKKNKIYKEAENQLNEVQKAFIEFDKSYILPRNHLNSALIGCYQASTEWEDKFIEEHCEQNNIKYMKKKRYKNIVMLAMNVSDDCDERTKARVRTYVRILKKFKQLDYDVETAKEQLEEFGTDYFANPRKKKEKSEETSKPQQLEFDFGTSSKNTSNEEDDDDSETDAEEISNDDSEEDKDECDFADEDDDENDKGKHRFHNCHISASVKQDKRSSKTFSEELIDLCNKYDFEDENFVLWICEDKVQMSIDKKLIKRLEKQNYKFEDL